MVPDAGETSSLQPPVESENILRDSTRKCKQGFQACLAIPDLDQDEWLEQKCAEFNWWVSGLNADKSGPGSLDSRLRLRPDVRDVVVDLLDGLVTALAKCEEVASSPSFNEPSSRALEADPGLVALDEMQRSPSPWSDMTDSSEGHSESQSGGEDSGPDRIDRNGYEEQRFYIETNLEILIRIHTAIKRSGLKFRNQRADEELKKAEERYRRQRETAGDYQTLHGSDSRIGRHERFRRFLTKLVLWNGYKDHLIQHMGRGLQLSIERNGEDHRDVLQQNKLIIVIRAYLQDPARLTSIQRRLIEANVVRRNRLIHAGSAAKPQSQANPAQTQAATTRPITVEPVKRPPQADELEDVLFDPPPPTKSIPRSNQGKDKDNGGKSFVSQVATALDPTFSVTGALSPPKATKSAVTKMSARLASIDYPKCPAKQGPFPCPFCPSILSDEYTKKSRWRAHIAQDLCAYVCLFEDCKSPDEMYASTYEWMSHMAQFHSVVEWVCPKCTEHRGSRSAEPFQGPGHLKEHLLAFHPEVEYSDIDLLIDASKRSVGIQRTRCPLCRPGLATRLEDDEDDSDCSDEDENDNVGDVLIYPGGYRESFGAVQLEQDDHIATHIHEFSLHSFPWHDDSKSERSLSHSTPSTRQEITFEQSEDLPPLSGEQGSMYSRADILEMLQDSIRDPLGEMTTRLMINYPGIATLDEIISQLKELSQDEYGLLDNEGILLAVNDLRVEISELQASSSDPANTSFSDLERALEIVSRHNARLKASLTSASPDKYDTDEMKDEDQENHGPNNQDELRRSLTGLAVLHSSLDPDLDICFVHGWTGDRISTWTSEGQAEPWPKTLLPREIPNARILTYGYDILAEYRSDPPSDALTTFGQDFISELGKERLSTQALDRPLIIVAHGLGGLICKAGLLIANDSDIESVRCIFNCTRGFIFMGTPHRGDLYRAWSNIPASLLILDAQLHNDKTSLWQLLRITEDSFAVKEQEFLMLLREREINGRPIQVMCYLEDKALDALGAPVVNSAMASFQPYYPVCSLSRDHRRMTQFDSGDEDFPGFYHHFSATIERAIAKPDKLMEDCLRSLDVPGIIHHGEAIEPAFRGTCNWLLRKDPYTAWAGSLDGILWITGKPGSGKSTLMKYVRDYQIRRVGEDCTRPIILSYFFDRDDNPLRKTTSSLYRSLVCQFLRQAPEASAEIIAASEVTGHRLGEDLDKTWQLFMGSLQRLAGRAVYMFIDGINDCNDFRAVVSNLRDMISVLRRENSVECRICLSCRHFPAIDYKGDPKICVEHENQDDISKYVQSELPPRVADRVLDHARGLFLWTRLVIPAIKHRSVGDADLEIDSPPVTLTRIYRDLSQGLGREPDSNSRKLLEWIAFAKRPLSIAELRWALMVDPNCPHESLEACVAKASPDIESLTEERITVLSHGLVEMSSHNGDDAKDTRFARFIHKSVRDFLIEDSHSPLSYQNLTNSMPGGAVVAIKMKFAQSHYRLSRTCIRYMGMREIAQSSMVNELKTKESLGLSHPFLLYATQFWTEHVSLAEEYPSTPNDLLTSLKWPSEDIILTWQWAWEVMHKSLYSDSEDTSNTARTKLVHIISQHGWIHPLRSMISNGGENKVDLSAKDKTGRTPISLAAGANHLVTVQFLFETDHLAFEEVDDFIRSPISHAAESDAVPVVEFFFRFANFDAKEKDFYGRTPLSYAAQRASKDMVVMILDKCGDMVDIKDLSGRSPLSYAVEGSEGVIDTILAASGPNVDIADNNGRTPLSYASENGNSFVVDLLLRNHANPNAVDKSGSSPLIRAISHGYVKVGLLLLARGADPNIMNNLGHTPLLVAAWNGNEKMVEGLVRCGALVDIRDDVGRSALSYACLNGYVSNAKHLLDRMKTSFINSKDKYGVASLSYAARKGHASIVQAIVETGRADINTQDQQGWTPLAHAAHKGFIDVVQALVGAAEADPGVQNGEERTPLSLAAEAGHTVVSRLLFRPDLINLRDKYGRTPLLYAALGQHWGTVLELINSRATDVDMPGSSGRTPLSFAAEFGQEVVVDQLLAKGQSSPDQQDISGRSAFDYALIHGNLEIATRIRQATVLSQAAGGGQKGTDVQQADEQEQVDAEEQVDEQEKMDQQQTDEED